MASLLHRLKSTYLLQLSSQTLEKAILLPVESSHFLLAYLSIRNIWSKMVNSTRFIFEQQMALYVNFEIKPIFIFSRKPPFPVTFLLQISLNIFWYLKVMKNCSRLCVRDSIMASQIHFNQYLILQKKLISEALHSRT